MCRYFKPSDDLDPSPPPSHGGFEALPPYTCGHVCPRLSCKSAISRVSTMPARDRSRSGSLPVSYLRDCCLIATDNEDRHRVAEAPSIVRLHPRDVRLAWPESYARELALRAARA